MLEVYWRLFSTGLLFRVAPASEVRVRSSFSATSCCCSTREVACSVNPRSWYCTCGTLVAADAVSEARFTPRFDNVFESPAELIPAMLVPLVARFE